jgi:hypothetical protein
MSGRWDEALARAGDVSSWDALGEMSSMLAVLPTICVNRGLEPGVQRIIQLTEEYEDSSDVQRTGGRAAALAVIRASEGKHAEALNLAKDALGSGLTTGADSPLLRIGLAQGVDSAFALGDIDRVEELLDMLAGLRRGEVWPSLAALGERTRARLATVHGGADGVESRFRAAAQTFRKIGMPYWLAATLTEHGEWLIGHERTAEARPLLAEAREIFERLQARPWLERLKVAQSAARSEVLA